MEKKTLVIVGAGKGMGNHIAKEFARHHFRVILMARRQEALDSYVAEFQTLGIECSGIVADASDPASLTAAFAAVQESFGVVDVMVYNAADLTPGSSATLSNEEVMQHYQVDVASALHCAQLALKSQAAAGGGAILFTSGGFALYPQAEYTCLSMGKAALRALAYAMHNEWKDRHIYVGVVTIMGNVAPATHYDPALIAQAYWKLYEQGSDVEIVYE